MTADIKDIRFSHCLNCGKDTTNGDRCEWCKRTLVPHNKVYTPKMFKGHCPQCLTLNIEISEAAHSSNAMTTSYSCDGCGETWGVRRGMIV